MKRRTSCCFLSRLAVAALWLVSAPSAGAITLTLSTDTALLVPGEGLVLNVRVSGLGDLAPPSLSVFDVTLEFDFGVLSTSPEHVTYSRQLGSVARGQADVFVVPGGASLNVAGLSVLPAEALNSVQGGSFLLFRVEFQVLSPQPVTIHAVHTLAGDADGVSLPIEPVAPLFIRPAEIFVDGFESGTTAAWSQAVSVAAEGSDSD